MKNGTAKKANMRNTIKISINSFLWLTSFLLVLVFMFVSYDSLNSIQEIAGKASDVRQVRLPDIIESQRSFINIESLRRLAEVVYVSDSPQIRRSARINAQALAAESVFGKNDAFHQEALELAKLIAELAGRRDAAYTNGIRLQELAREYTRSILHMAAYVPNMEVVLEVVQSFMDTSIPQAGPVGLSRQSISRISALRGEDARHTAFIKKQCELYSILYASLIPICQRQGELYKEYSDTQDILISNFTNAHAQWTSVDSALREMRDNVSSDSEFVTTDALTSIEDTAAKALATTKVFFVGGAMFFLFYLLALHRLIVLPLRWTEKKLQDLQQGVHHGPVPDIRIVELFHVADLLDRFGVHLAELTSHASQLAEDAAEKKNLEALMSAVFQVSVDGYCVWDKEGLYTVNNELLRLLGLKSAEAINDKREALGLTEEEHLPQLYDEVVRTGLLRKEQYIRNRLGEELPVEITSLPILRQGRVCILSYFRDLREQKRTEASLRAAKDEAEAAAQVKSEFLARMSHEIRTPMNGVLGLTHLALAGSPPPEQRKYLEKIQASARILLRVINDILDFSKMESGRFSLEHRPYAFGEMLATVVDLFKAQAEGKGLDFCVESDARIPAVLAGDDLRLSQVLLNLCGNAIKFTDKGSVVLRVTLESETDTAVSVRFAVEDTGLGMSEQELAGLFQPFSQADTSTTRKYGGTGLGLVISKLLVEMMHGTITVVSAVGKGSTFTFTIPLDRASEELAASTLAPQEEALNDAALAGLRILLAEDNEVNQEIAVALLQSLGASVIVASNGAEAVKALHTHDVDGVLMDIQMPVMDGLTAARTIRQQGREGVRDLPIIAMTAHAMQEDRDKSFAAGMNDHITKPIDVQELREKLLTRIARVRREQSAANSVG